MSRYRVDWMCEPCGSCPRCRAKFQAKLDRAALRVEVRKLRKLLREARGYVRSIAEADAGDECVDPHAEGARRLIRRIDRASP